MHAQLTEVPPAKPRVEGSMLHRLSVDEFEQMADLEIVPSDASVELIDGLVYLRDRSGHGEEPTEVNPAHAYAVHALGLLDGPIRGLGPFHLRAEKPVQVSESYRPLPDASIVRGSFRDYAARHPDAGDALCVVEVSISTLNFDRATKLPLFARAGIPQYVILDLDHRQAEVHADPKPDGTYGRREVVVADGTLTVVLDEHRLDVPLAELLP